MEVEVVVEVMELEGEGGTPPTLLYFLMELIVYLVTANLQMEQHGETKVVVVEVEPQTLVRLVFPNYLWEQVVVVEVLAKIGVEII